MTKYAVYGDKKTEHHHKYVKSRNYKRLNDGNLLKDLQSAPWSTIDIDDAWSFWKILFRQIIDLYAPIKKFRAKRNPCKWFSADIDELKSVLLRTLGSNWPTKFHLKIYHFLRRQNDVTSKFTFTHVNPQDVFRHLHELDPSKATGHSI